MKIVIIGYGGMGGYHAGCLKSYSESAPEAPVEVVGVYDIDPERAAAGEKAGYKAYKSPEEIWADKAVDAVLIATPNDVHAAYVEAAAKAGKHIICEKPIGMSVKEAEEMYDAAEKAGVVFEVHQNRRWDDDFLTVKNIVDNERAGEAYLIESRVMGGNGIPLGHAEPFAFYKNFAAACAGKAETAIKREEVVRVYKLMEAAARSAAENIVIKEKI